MLRKISAAATLSTSSSASQDAPDGVQRVVLSNGLTLLMQPQHMAPVVALQAWVNVGSADERPDEAGLAHLHEHMLFKGTQRRGVSEIARTVEECGGEINAWTSFDQTVYHVVLGTEEMATGVDLLADALQHSTFDARELQKEIEVVVEEIRRAQDAPSRRLSRALFELAYTRHPYRRPVLGTEESVRSFDRAKVLSFFENHYRPDEVTFVAVGDFDPSVVRDLVESAFGSWRATGVRKVYERAVEPPAAQPRFAMLVEDVQEARCSLSWSIGGMCHQDIAALDALGVVLGHGESSRLSREVRRGAELVNDAYAFAYTPKDPGLFMLGAGLKRGKVQAGVEALFDCAYRLRREPVSLDELNAAKVVILSEAAYQKETVQGQARKLGTFALGAGDHRYERDYIRAIRDLTVDDLQRVAQVYLNENPSWVLQSHSEQDAPALGSAGVPGAPLSNALPEVAPQRFKRSQKRAALPPLGDLGVIRHRLKCGALVLIRPEPTEVVATRVAALGGQRYETPDNAGVGYLFSAIWGNATTELSTDAFARRAATLGGSVSAFCGRNALGLRSEFIAERAREGLQLTLDTLLYPAFSEAELTREREALLQRIRNREDNGPAVAFDLFAQALFPRHPYGMKLTGTPETVTRLSLGEVTDFGLSLLAPERLVIAVVGGVDAAVALEVLERWAEDASGAGLAARVPPSIPIDGPRESRLRQHQVLDKQQSHIVVGAMGTTLDDDDRYALEVLTTILSGQGGRLFTDLRDERSLAYSVSCSALEGLDPGHVWIHMGTSPDKIDQALSGIDEHLERVRQELVSDGELLRAKRYLTGTHAIDLQRAGARGMSMALGECFSLGYDHYTRYGEKIAAVTPQKVQAVAQRFLSPERLVEVVVGPARS